MSKQLDGVILQIARALRQYRREIAGTSIQVVRSPISVEVVPRNSEGFAARMGSIAERVASEAARAGRDECDKATLPLTEKRVREIVRDEIARSSRRNQ